MEGYIPPPWEITEENDLKSQGWFAFQDLIEQDPHYVYCCFFKHFENRDEK